MLCCKTQRHKCSKKTLEIKRSIAVKWCGRRDSNSQGCSPNHRHPTRITVWRVNQFRHVRVVKQRPCYIQSRWLVKSSDAYNHTMTVTESSCRMTNTVSARVLKQHSTKPPLWKSRDRHTNRLYQQPIRRALHSKISCKYTNNNLLRFYSVRILPWMECLAVTWVGGSKADARTSFVHS